MNTRPESFCLISNDELRHSAPYRTVFQSDGSFALSLDTPPGGTLSIESSSDLTRRSLLQAVTNTTTRVNITDPAVRGKANRTYRAQAK